MAMAMEMVIQTVMFSSTPLPALFVPRVTVPCDVKDDTFIFQIQLLPYLILVHVQLMMRATSWVVSRYGARRLGLNT